jgi:hypothetical protein
MPAVTTNADTSIGPTGSRVFVLELDGTPKFAFEAMESSAAGGIFRSAWFRRALERFCPNPVVTDSTTLLRPATDREASAFYDLAEEFAEPAAHFLVARLPLGA